MNSKQLSNFIIAINFDQFGFTEPVSIKHGKAFN